MSIYNPYSSQSINPLYQVIDILFIGKHAHTVYTGFHQPVYYSHIQDNSSTTGFRIPDIFCRKPLRQCIIEKGKGMEVKLSF